MRFITERNSSKPNAPMQVGAFFLFSVAPRRWKLASYEVAGFGSRKSFVLKGRWEMCCWIPASFQDALFFNVNPATS